MVTCSAEVMGSIPSSDGFFGFLSEKNSCPSVVSCNTPVQRTVWGELWVSQLVSHTTSLLNILRVSVNSLNSLNDLGSSFFFFFSVCTRVRVRVRVRVSVRVHSCVCRPHTLEYWKYTMCVPVSGIIIPDHMYN